MNAIGFHALGEGGLVGVFESERIGIAPAPQLAVFEQGAARSAAGGELFCGQVELEERGRRYAAPALRAGELRAIFGSDLCHVAGLAPSRVTPAAHLTVLREHTEVLASGDELLGDPASTERRLRGQAKVRR